MGKALLCIKMLELLNTGKIYKISELAELLDTNPRNIPEYKKELEDCGYVINSVSGKYGGLILDKSNLLTTIKLTNEEKDALNESFRYLMGSDTFLNKEQYQFALGKIFSKINDVDPIKEPFMVISKEGLSQENNDIEEKYNLIKNCIANQHVVKIKYVNNNNNILTKTIKPYDLYIYNENWFVIADVVENKKISCMKLMRMTELVDTNIEFTRDIFYKKSDYIDENGYKKNNEWYDIKFEVKGYSLFMLKQKKIGINQNIYYINKNKAIVNVTMQYKYNIISFILSMADECKVIEPEWLKKAVQKKLNDITDLYIREQ